MEPGDFQVPAVRFPGCRSSLVPKNATFRKIVAGEHIHQKCSENLVDCVPRLPCFVRLTKQTTCLRPYGLAFRMLQVSCEKPQNHGYLRFSRGWNVIKVLKVAQVLWTLLGPSQTEALRLEGFLFPQGFMSIGPIRPARLMPSWLRSHASNGTKTLHETWAPFKTLLTFHYTGCLIGILTMASYNPHISG